MLDIALIDPDKIWEVLVLISDLDIIVKTTRRDMFVFAQNMLSRTPYPAAKVILSDGAKALFEGATDDDGVFQGSKLQL